MTLIEISIGLLILGLLMGVALPALEGVTGVRAREAAGKMTGLIRYLHSHSAITGKSCRLAFDIDARAYWAQCSEGVVTLDAEKEQSRDGAKVEEEKKDTDFASDGFAFDDRAAAEQEKQRIAKQAEFSEFTDDTIKKETLPQGVTMEVWVDHQREPYKKGLAYLYFFPQGYTERAQIWLSANETVFTLKVSAITGKVKVSPDRLELPRDVR